LENKEFHREILVYRSYFWNFYGSQNAIVKRKIEWTLGLIRDLPIVPERYFKSIKGVRGLYEIRVQSGNIACRIFCCFVKENLIVLLNAFSKKTQKTPAREIKKALRIKTMYFNEKRE